MSYSKAIFRIDLVSGSDTARSALASCNMTNSSGVVTVAKTGHGLVNGAVVTVPSGTYAGNWLVKKTDNDNFTLHTNHSIGVITITGTPVVNETFVIGTQTFTFKASRGGVGEVTIGTSIFATCQNICFAINTDIGGVSGNYMAFGDKLLKFDEGFEYVSVYYIPPGTGGNSITFTESATGISVDGSGTLSGGADSTYSADRSGVSITPNGGMSWSDAWFTLTTGASAARIAPGDRILISKSPDSYSVGNATWTNGSPTVTLSSAQTLNICLCEADWTPVNATSSAKLAAATDGKQGSYCVKIVEDGTPANGEVQAYFATGDLTLSSYQKISFWIKNEVAITAGMLVIELCSDTGGATAIDSFQIPAIASTGKWVPLIITRDGGGNLGHNDGTTVKSIRVTNGASSYYTASKYIYIDNIIACTTSGLNLQSLISKETSQGYTEEGWFCIKSINDTEIIIDISSQAKVSEYKNYTGTTTTSPTYARETFKIPIALNAYTYSVLSEGGNITAYNSLIGGWNTSTNVKDGITFFDALNNNARALSDRTYTIVENFGSARSDIGLSVCSQRSEAKNLMATASSHAHGGIYVGGEDAVLRYSTSYHTISSGCRCYNSNSLIFNCVIINNSLSLQIVTAIIKYCTIDSIFQCDYYSLAYGLKTYIYSSFILSVSSYSNSALFQAFSFNEDNIEGNNWVYYDGATVNWDTTVFHGANPGSWKIILASSNRIITLPIKLKIAEVALEADKLVTIKAWAKKDSTTNIGCRLVSYYNYYLGISEVADVKENDTDWEELSISFTPTKSGVQEIYFETYYVSNPSNSYVGSITVTQE